MLKQNQIERIIGIATISIALTACGGGSSGAPTASTGGSLNFPTAGLNSGTSDSPLTVGSVTFGAVIGATIVAHETKSNGNYDDGTLNADGTSGTPSKKCGQALTDSSGLFAMNLNGSNCHMGSNAQTGRPEILTFSMTGGYYIEESTGAHVPLTQVFHAVLVISDPANAPSNITVSIGPVTDIAWRLFINSMTPGALSGSDGSFFINGTSSTSACGNGESVVPGYADLAVCANAANQTVQQALGLSDIVGVLPQQNSAYNNVILAISTAAKNASTDSVAIVNSYGTLIGQNGNLGSTSSVSVLNGNGQTVSITPPIFSSL